MSGNVSLGSLDPCRSVETSVACCSEIPRGLCRRPLGIRLPTVFTCKDSPGPPGHWACTSQLCLRVQTAPGPARPQGMHLPTVLAPGPALPGNSAPVEPVPPTKGQVLTFGGFHAPTHKSWSDCRPQKTDKTRWGDFSWSFSRGGFVLSPFCKPTSKMHGV